MSPMRLKYALEFKAADREHLLILDVPASCNAPHQAADKRYYARRLFRVDPLLAFEVDDFRRRVTSLSSGASLFTKFQNGSVSFSIENEGLGHIFDVSIQIDGIENTTLARQWTPGLDRPYTEPFRTIHSGETRHFLGASFEFMQSKLDDRMDIHLFYKDEDRKQHQKTYTYFLKDFHSTVRLKTPIEEALGEGVKQLEKIEQSLTKLSRDVKIMQERAFHPTGLSLSKTTLGVLSQGANVTWPGQFLTFEALAEVLEIDIGTALKIQHELFAEFHLAGGISKPLDEIDLPDDVKERIRQRLIMPT